MATASTLSEPQVLAHTKRRLFPDDEAENAYAVVDTQFAQDEWLPNRPIPEALRKQLAPFNHVRIGSGYPDLVGVRLLDSELLAVDRVGDEPPLVAIEAKGYTGDGAVDVETGVVQAYDRLNEVNAAYVAAPGAAISQSARTLARELNVGVLAVDVDGEVTPCEVPRIVGNHTAEEATAIRFQATAQGVADKSFGLNHPKNYLGYPLAIYHTAETETVLAERVVGAVDSARQGATFLGLINNEPDGERLTPLGQEVVRFALNRYGSVDAALNEFAGWKRSRKRFCELAPEWGLVTRRVVWAYPATQLLVEELQTMHDDGISKPSLVDLVEWLHVHHPTFTVELFLKGSDDVRRRVLTEDGELRPSELADGAVFHSPTVFQLKAMLYHAGVLTERGAEPNRLDPHADDWALRQPLDRFR
ncbi:hypothetical protein halTADL_0428 [Halohasta litchfieldiae]|jgi:hypothetical protein|uniref:Uncharacterized protein n=1 Tax=Halohasta litchfieldiae TaxID=1073996 RepID=A0A1H6VZF3_9EURY|nr:hypothetical protein [Halohasta litchfieldiae]ATW87242.1 hypothetical protein halTADL_0428 [Halohasta litchfieldiae]SEJ08484.1 hypothetical protein SAMN05444271_12021 [Halohasta litchfieldiae]